jgi:hypothetical protein
VSLGVLYLASRLTPWIGAAIVLAAVAGTGMILLYARKPHPAA